MRMVWVVAFEDFVETFRRLHLPLMLGWQDVRQRYRRSRIGPFWITISMGIMIATIGLVFGNLFKTRMHDFLPFLTIGLISWNLISSTINEGCVGLIAAESLIKQIRMPAYIHVFRVLWRNLIMFFHNMIILPVVFFFYPRHLGVETLLVVPGLLLTIGNIAWIAILLAVVCARYRDVPQIIQNFLQVMFYLTPIIWMPRLLPAGGGEMALSWNPFACLLTIIRAPMLGEMPDAGAWSMAIVLLVAGWTMTFWVYGKCRGRIAYWV